MRVHFACPWLVAVAALAGAAPLHAGGQMTFGDDSSANDGPPFFGFVRDAGGSPVAGARVTATVKSGGAIVSTANSMGVYKFPGFAKDIDPNSITISCAKSGYKESNVVRREPGDSKDPIEVDCTLQKD